MKDRKPTGEFDQRKVRGQEEENLDISEKGFSGLTKYSAEGIISTEAWKYTNCRKKY
jgi:hypothetical protein